MRKKASPLTKFKNRDLLTSFGISVLLFAALMVLCGLTVGNADIHNKELVRYHAQLVVYGTWIGIVSLLFIKSVANVENFWDTKKNETKRKRRS